MVKSVKKAVILVVTSKVKAFCKANDCRIGTDAMRQLSAEVEIMLERACEHAHEDRRQTIKDRDFDNGVVTD